MINDRKRLAAAPLRASVRRHQKQERVTVSFRSEAQVHALKALETLTWLSENATSESVRVSAANAVLDRAHGKPASGGWAAARFQYEEAGESEVLEVQWLPPGQS